MSPDGSSFSPFSPTTQTLQDVLERVDRSDLPIQTRRNLASALRGLSRIAGRPLHRIPLRVDVIRDLLIRDDWGAFGYTESNWANTRSSVKRAIEVSGLPFITRIDRAPLTLAWEALIGVISAAQAKSNLKRLAHFCSERQITPAKVDDATVQAFREHLEQDICTDPERAARDALSAWNRFVVPHAGYGRLSSRGRREIYILQWSAFPTSLEQDATRYRDATSGTKLFDDQVHRARPATAKKRHDLMRRFATALVLSGVDPAELRSLRDLFTPTRAKTALEFFIARNGGQASVQAHEMAHLATVIGKYWCHLPTTDVDELTKWRSKLRTKRQGLTDRNLRRLAQFADPKVQSRFLNFPYQLAARASAIEINFTSAMMMQKAVAIAILQHAPIRIFNLRHLRWKAHFIRQMTANGATLVLSIALDEVKNEMPLTFPLPGELADLLKRYVEAYQPILAEGDTPYLFPGRSGRPKSENAMRKTIEGVIAKELGLEVNPHLFRHICAYLVLTANPGQYETVRRLLGHKSLQTTINAYVGFEMAPASEQLNAILAKMRKEGT